MKQGNNVVVKLRIADTIIQMKSRFPLEQFTKEEERAQAGERFDNFFYKGRQTPHILVNVEIVDKLPEIKKTKPVFITYHFQDGSENWRLLKRGKSYVYKSPLEDKKQAMLVNKAFDRVTAYLLPKKQKGKVWNTSDIIYDFLQVLLINYFALNKQGIFTHSIGVKDLNGKGLLFAGKSGAGKSTTARLWHKHSKAMVLNDDRIIVRKLKKKFFIYGAPWHGDFSDYLESHIESARLEKLFFIHHSPKNTIRQISRKRAFNLLYPALFPTFWDKGCLENIISFCQDLVKTVPCYSLGFVNDRKVIDFVRRVSANAQHAAGNK
ncbi:MAG: hypothetical protein KAS99_01095 [Candidatus Omnitrophica bacterium]|nr:hypothetical protein [Candidatus Omnitrophota bacterium]